MKPEDLTLYLVTNPLESEDKFLKTIEEAIKGGVTIVQLREKTGDTGDIYKIALKVKEITDKYNIPLIINDRIDIMLAIDCDGIHIGQSDMPCDITRKIVGNDKIIGVSASNLKEAKKAEKDGADYIGCGAIYPTKTKKDPTRVTKEELKEISEKIDIPVVAIGGIKIENVEELNDTGIKGISIVSEIMNSDNPKLASKKLLEKIKL